MSFLLLEIKCRLFFSCGFNRGHGMQFHASEIEFRALYVIYSYLLISFNLLDLEIK